MSKFISHCEADTVKIGYNLASKLNKGDVVAVFGDLGAGKTALTKGIAKYFGISETQSPTFTLVNEYYGSETIYHFDAYRINGDDFINSGFDEYLFGEGICIIEWAENLTDILPQNSINVNITKNTAQDDNFREIEVRL